VHLVRTQLALRVLVESNRGGRPGSRAANMRWGSRYDGGAGKWRAERCDRDPAIQALVLAKEMNASFPFRGGSP
jgi:hypothetical protein